MGSMGWGGSGPWAGSSLWPLLLPDGGKSTPLFQFLCENGSWHNRQLQSSTFVYRDLSYARTLGEDFEILFYSALSLFCCNHANEFRVVTGLPVERIHLAEDLQARVRGERTIKILRGGEVQDTRVYVSEVEIVPQPLATYWSEFLSPEGEKSAFLMQGLTGVIDIGFRTTDLAAIEDGEYIPEKSKSLSVGLATAYSDIGSNLAMEYGLGKEHYALDGVIIERKIYTLVRERT